MVTSGLIQLLEALLEQGVELHEELWNHGGWGGGVMGCDAIDASGHEAGERCGMGEWRYHWFFEARGACLLHHLVAGVEVVAGHGDIIDGGAWHEGYLGGIGHGDAHYGLLAEVLAGFNSCGAAVKT